MGKIMGKEKYIKTAEELFKKSPVVHASSIERIIKHKGYTKQFIRNLIKRGKIKRLVKGWYTTRNDPSLAVFCFKPAYLGLQDALSFHNLWEQETIPVIITTAKVRQGIKNVLDSNLLIRHIDKKYFFGFDYCEYSSGLYLPYSDIEKTFIDMVHFKQKLDKSTIEEIQKKADRKKLKAYLKKYPEKTRKRVLALLGLECKNSS